VILTPKQEHAARLLQSPARHTLLDGGSRSGKSALLVWAIVQRALKAQRSRHAILRFRFQHVKESIGMDTLPKVMRTSFPEVPYELNKSDWYVTLPNDSEIWLGGLDDKERTEKILGKEYATMFLNECSQIPFTSRNLAVTRLAQRVGVEKNGEAAGDLSLKMYYDQNPPSKSHWTYQLFYLARDPETKRPLEDSSLYTRLTMNPGDNLENLPADYLKELANLPARLRRRFLEGTYGEAAPDALWTEEIIDRHRWGETELPDLQRVVVAIDPSGSGDEDNAGNDEIGIVVAGLGTDGNGYVLEDLTLKAGPEKWGKAAAAAYSRHSADIIVGETNFGGDMVRMVVKAADPKAPFKKLTASRGKVVRAEPISALTEQGRIRFVGRFVMLEDELCGFTTHGYTGTGSPNRADAFVWAMSELFLDLWVEGSKATASR
jgi:hypothetical protein